MTAPGVAGGGREVEIGMALMIVAMLIVPGIDAIAKYLSATVSAGEVTWSRFLFQVLFLAPIAFFGARPMLPSDLALHALRGALIAATTLLFFVALKDMPIADAISIFFVAPLILTLLSAVFLGERVGWRRLAAIGAGFVGALIVIQPSFEAVGWTAALPLLAALMAAIYLVLTRRLAPRGDPVAMQLAVGIFGCLVMSAALGVGTLAHLEVLTPLWPSAWEWLLMAGLGAIATAAHVLIVHAFKRAPAGALAPFQYLEIFGATVLGLIVFGDFPRPATWAGIAIIVGSGLYVFARERRIASDLAAARHQAPER